MFLPLVLLAGFLVSMAGMMSGLTLGLMSLDQVDIEVGARSAGRPQGARRLPAWLSGLACLQEHVLAGWLPRSSCCASGHPGSSRPRPAGVGLLSVQPLSMSNGA